MNIQRTIPIILDKNQLVDDTIVEFNRYQRTISETCFNSGKHLRALDLHHKVYHHVQTVLTSQMKCNAIRATAAAYASAKSNRRPATHPFIFRHPQALFLFTKDFSFRRDGSLSISTLQGRQKIGWKIPEHFKKDFDSAKSIDSLRLAKGKAFLCITLEVPEPKSVIPVGIDLGIKNALVASTAKKTFVIRGKTLSIKNTKTRKVRSRLQKKLAEKKAQHLDTRSVRRVLKRLSRTTKNRNKTFCQETAAKLCDWVPPNAILVFEDLNLKPKSKKEHMRNGTRRKLNSWFFNLMMTAVKNRAERQGLGMAYVNPSFTSQRHNVCGLIGQRFGSKFYCPSCGVREHADVNASKNILSDFTVLRSSGLLSTSPEALTCVEGKPTDLSVGS
jgi:IS605 OrfB family transposase